MKKDYEKFVEVVFLKLPGIYSGRIESINFQTWGFSADDVKRYWAKMRKNYTLPHARKIEQAVIFFRS